METMILETLIGLAIISLPSVTLIAVAKIITWFNERLVPSYPSFKNSPFPAFISMYSVILAFGGVMNMTVKLADYLLPHLK